MEFEMKSFAVKQQMIADVLIVTFSDGSIKNFNAFVLGCEWLKMSNDAFYDLYGFNFNPHEYVGLYESCRKFIYKN